MRTARAWTTAVVVLAWAVPVLAQSPSQARSEGCAPKTFHTASPEGWFVTAVQDAPDDKEGCIFILYGSNKRPAAVIQIESAPASLAIFREGDPFEILPPRIAAGLEANMNVVVKTLTAKNDDVKRAPQSPIERASMLVYDAELIGNSSPHEAVIVVARSPGVIFTVVVIAPSAKADATTSTAARRAFQTILNSLAPGAGR
jgi:hypothetical protein